MHNNVVLNKFPIGKNTLHLHCATEPKEHVCLLLFVSGASHYLFMTWFLYDTINYYTDSEYKMAKNFVS